ncbi:unnamed protein product [Choristocarpus tenellus]
MLYADDPGIFSNTQGGWPKMTVIVKVVRSFPPAMALNTEAMCLRRPNQAAAIMQIQALGQTCKQADKFVYLGDTLSDKPAIIAEISQTIQKAWSCFCKYRVQH